MKRIAALFMVSSLVFQLGCGLDQCCQRKSSCSSYSKGSDDCAQKSCAQKSYGDHGCAQKDCTQKDQGICGCAQKSSRQKSSCFAQKGCAQKSCAQNGNGDYGCAQKGCQQKGSTQKGCGHGCEQKASQQKLGYDTPQALEIVIPTPTVPVIADGLYYDGIVR